MRFEIALLLYVLDGLLTLFPVAVKIRGLDLHYRTMKLCTLVSGHAIECMPCLNELSHPLYLWFPVLGNTGSTVIRYWLLQLHFMCL
jgi:hypothetical protein